MGNQALLRPSIEELFDRHYEQLIRSAIRYLDRRERAEDVVQDVFLQYQLKQCAPAPGSEYAYLRTMVNNAARSQLRRRLVEQKHQPREMTVAPSAEASALARLRERRVRAAVGRLPERQRAVIAGQHFGGQRLVEIADQLGISDGSVKRHAHRARQRLHAHLLDEAEHAPA